MKIINDIIKNANNLQGEIKMIKDLDEREKYSHAEEYFFPDGEFQFDSKIKLSDLREFVDSFEGEKWNVEGNLRLKIANGLRLLNDFINDIHEIREFVLEFIEDYKEDGFSLKLAIQYQDLLDIDLLQITVFAYYE